MEILLRALNLIVGHILVLCNEYGNSGHAESALEACEEFIASVRL